MSEYLKHDLAVQTRCVSCKREQYALAAYQISIGKGGCSWCGYRPGQMTEKEYKEAYKKLNPQAHEGSKEGKV